MAKKVDYSGQGMVLLKMMFREGLSYDDVLLEPGYSDILPRECDIKTKLCDGIQLNIPIISA
ncbi:MAG: IMP dehydrogenase, partial [Treponema sp.]|nr:IMP dehydrogenase [Treponema sp.]